MSGSPLLQSAELLRLGTTAAKAELAFDALRGKTVAIYFSGACWWDAVWGLDRIDWIDCW